MTKSTRHRVINYDITCVQMQCNEQFVSACNCRIRHFSMDHKTCPQQKHLKPLHRKKMK